MCGRYVLVTPLDEFARFFAARLPDPNGNRVGASYNVAPSRNVVGVAELAGERLLGTYRWGLIPSWARDPAIGNRLINARAETVATKPAFRAAFASRRLAVLADGFYEWRKEGSGRPQPYYLTRADGAPLAFAGLFERWRDPRPGAADEPIVTCTIVTTGANTDVARIHDRMPAVLARDGLEVWLEASTGRDELEALLAPAPPGTLLARPVDRRVGDVRNDDPALIEPLAAPPG